MRETRERLRERAVTVIETWGMPEDPIDIAVGFSHPAVGRDIARFLHGRGYARPLLTVADGARARQRRDGFIEEWRTTGQSRPWCSMCRCRRASGIRAWCGGMWRRLRAPPDVIVCGSDVLAQGVIIEAQAAGVRVPDQVAVVGFGNLAIAGDMRPSITTVDVDGARIGREAVSVLRRRAAGEQIAQTVIDVGFRLIARESA